MAIFQCDLICFTKSFLSRIKYGTGCSSAMRVKFSQTYKKITSSFGVDYFLPLPLLQFFYPF